MTGTINRKFTRREFATLFLGAALAGGASRASAAVNPAEGYVGRIADEVMSLANSGAKGTALRGKICFRIEPLHQSAHHRQFCAWPLPEASCRRRQE